MKWCVGVKEVHTRYCYVDADTPEEAIGRVSRGEGEDDTRTSINVTINESEWTVKAITEEGVAK